MGLFEIHSIQTSFILLEGQVSSTWGGLGEGVVSDVGEGVQIHPASLKKLTEGQFR